MTINSSSEMALDAAELAYSASTVALPESLAGVSLAEQDRFSLVTEFGIGGRFTVDAVGLDMISGLKRNDFSPCILLNPFLSLIIPEQ